MKSQRNERMKWWKKITERKEREKEEREGMKRMILAPLHGAKPPIWHEATHTHTQLLSIVFRNPLLEM